MNKNAVDEYCDSALHLASNNGSKEIVELLLNKDETSIEDGVDNVKMKASRVAS